MKEFGVVAWMVLSVAVAGCAQHPAPQDRGYSAAEHLELALEALNRRGLSFDEYQQRKAELLGQDLLQNGAQINADLGVDTVAPKSWGCTTVRL